MVGREEGLRDEASIFPVEIVFLGLWIVALALQLLEFLFAIEAPQGG
jgi:hypothetical protein